MTVEALQPERLPRMTPAQYVAAVAQHVAGGPKVSARLARAVLHAIAVRSDWGAATWGSNSVRSAEGIGAEIGYTDRAVRLAYRVLEEQGWLIRDPRPGRTNRWTIVPQVDAPPAPPPPVWTKNGRRVRNHLRPVDDVGDNTPRSPAAARSPISDPPEMGSADLGALPTDPPPEGPPVARKSNADGAGAPAQAAPRAPRPGAPPLGPDPGRVAAVGVERHRRGVGADAVPDVAAGHPLDGPVSLRAASARLGWGDPPPGWARGELSGQPARRDALRRRRCETCGAAPGEACRGRRGGLRRSNHRDRGD